LPQIIIALEAPDFPTLFLDKAIRSDVLLWVFLNENLIVLRAGVILRVPDDVVVPSWELCRPECPCLHKDYVGKKVLRSENFVEK